MFFFFKDTATTEIYTLSLHDALPISRSRTRRSRSRPGRRWSGCGAVWSPWRSGAEPRVGEDLSRSEEDTSDLQSRQYLVCRLLVVKKIIEEPRSMRYIHSNTV